MLIYIAVLCRRGCGEVTDAGYKCLIAALGALEAGIDDRMYDRGLARCFVPQEGNNSEQTAGTLTAE